MIFGIPVVKGRHKPLWKQAMEALSFFGVMGILVFLLGGLALLCRAVLQ